ncbi:hypothetical protein PHSY_006044 [Pseudozyma hubeiensis SY62]|uniref:Uncharacterized protein n=1 Tax=Pseudozyma hubeiensis (strain SY62) TaxID=1305764 RepID=R9PK20_PSEHS|nr:hypothetical protein PHSY_006044 [Pseudozyma hubeiensis SY62]GAC98450.1 hypothetical protein PHSY_006044 [Pseudozyma hubeiensis SY62]
MRLDGKEARSSSSATRGDRQCDGRCNAAARQAPQGATSSLLYHGKRTKADTRHIAYPHNRAGPCFNLFLYRLHTVHCQVFLNCVFEYFRTGRLCALTRNESPASPLQRAAEDRSIQQPHHRQRLEAKTKRLRQCFKSRRVIHQKGCTSHTDTTMSDDRGVPRKRAWIAATAACGPSLAASAQSIRAQMFKSMIGQVLASSADVDI